MKASVEPLQEENSCTNLQKLMKKNPNKVQHINCHPTSVTSWYFNILKISNT